MKTKTTVVTHESKTPAYDDVVRIRGYIRKALQSAEKRGATREWWKTEEGKHERKAIKALYAASYHIDRTLNPEQFQKGDVKLVRNPSAKVNYLGEELSDK